MTDEERIRAAYGRYDDAGRARLWDRSNRGYARLAQDRDDLVADLIQLSAGSDSALVDVGCGTGEAALLAARATPTIRYTGIDLLEERIATARVAVPQGDFVAGPADAMPFADESFALALAATLFSSLPSASLEEAVAREIGRVLKPGGWLIWYDLRRNNPWNPAVHGVTESRLAALFPGWHRELRAFTLAPPIARRLGPLTPVAYPLLHALPPLRTHLIGRLQCPS